MLSFNKILSIGLLVAFACSINAENNSSQYAAPETPEKAILTQLKFKVTNSVSGERQYKCTAGSKRSNRSACRAEDSNQWNSPHDVLLLLRCPDSGTLNEPISYVEFNFTVTSDNFDCFIAGGGIGSKYIVLMISTSNTMKFDYFGDVYY